MGFLPIFSHRSAPAIFATLALLALLRPANAEVLGVEGRVVLRESPVSDARVYAYQLVEKSMHKVLTDGSGRFLFEALPAGIYKLIAHKAGLLPAVLLLQRDAAEATQFVELELTEKSSPDLADFWSVRSQIPGDVLRDITQPSELASFSGSAGSDASNGSSAAEVANLVIGSGSEMDSRLLAEVSAMSGVHDVTPQASARLTGANVGLKGQLGKVKLAMAGDFQTFESELSAPVDSGLGIDGQTHSVSFNLQTPAQGDFDLSSSSNRLSMMDDGFSSPVEASQLFFSWNRGVGESGKTSVKASLVEENGLYNRAWIDPLGLPISSSTLRIEGDYAQKLANWGDLRAGLRYRETTGAYALHMGRPSNVLLASQTLEAYGGGGWRANSKLLVQYGLFSTLTDGSISITPRGGFVLQTGRHWQTSVTAAQRVVAQDDSARNDFLPLLLDDKMSCGEAEAACYQVAVMRSSGVDDQLALGASYREIDSTVRMYFNGNFFESSEGIFLVRGDRLPELHASLRQRLSPGIVAKISASVAEGGGGVFQSVNRRHYENQVSMVTSGIDATFEKTSTGVYLSFHRLDQQLEPVRRPGRPNAVGPATGLERLELTVSQDLSAIWDLSLDWAVHVGMGLARGASFFHSEVDSEAIQRRVMTGVAVRF